MRDTSCALGGRSAKNTQGSVRCMRISEDRYFRDLRQIQLAILMLNFEAHTRTICTWTVLPKDRLCKLALSTAQPSSPMFQ